MITLAVLTIIIPPATAISTGRSLMRCLTLCPDCIMLKLNPANGIRHHGTNSVSPAIKLELNCKFLRFNGCCNFLLQQPFFAPGNCIAYNLGIKKASVFRYNTFPCVSLCVKKEPQHHPQKETKIFFEKISFCHNIFIFLLYNMLYA